MRNEKYVEFSKDFDGDAFFEPKLEKIVKQCDTAIQVELGVYATLIGCETDSLVVNALYEIPSDYMEAIVLAQASIIQLKNSLTNAHQAFMKCREQYLESL